MPVYNAGEFLVDAMESILNQTYKNFEFIIVDDASTDNSYEILKRYAKLDKRIKIYRSKRNLKQALTTNKAIDFAKGDFIARMDADDISHPQRLEKQMQYLLKHKKTVAVGGQCILVDREGNAIGEKRFPTNFKDIYNYIYHFIPVQQPTLMIAKNRLPSDFTYYDHNMSPVEDVEFLFKLFKHGKVENLSEYILFYRIHNANSSLVNLKKSFYLTLVSRIRALFLHGYKPTISGIIMTTIQTIIVLFFPQQVGLLLYGVVRQLKSSPLSFNLSSQKVFAKIELGI